MEDKRLKLKREAEELEEKKRQLAKCVAQSALQTAQTKTYLTESYVNWLQNFFQNRVTSLTMCSQSHFNSTSSNKLQGGRYDEVDFFVLTFRDLNNGDTIYTLKGLYKYHYHCPKTYVRLFQGDTSSNDSEKGELLYLETGYSFDEYVRKEADDKNTFTKERQNFEDVLQITEGYQIDLFYAFLQGFLRTYLMEMQKMNADDDDADILRLESLGVMFKCI
jgi:hypothetical protein